MSTLLDARLTSICCRAVKSRAFLSFFTPKILDYSIWEAWSQLQCSAHVSCSPWLHGSAKLAEKVRHGPAVLMREVEMILSLTHQTGEFRGQTAVSSFAPSCQAQHYMASNTSETWDTTLQLATKGLLASGALQREPPCLFWDTREASELLKRGNVVTMLIRHPTGVPSPQSWLHATYWCNTPAWTARQTKELGNSWQRNPVY